MNGKVRIGGALIAGIIIIFGALKVSAERNFSPEASVIVATAPERTYIESSDSNHDGVKDWEENLKDRFPSIDIAPMVAGASTSKTSSYTPPTTLTGKFSIAFFQDYMKGKAMGRDYSDPSQFIGKAVTAIQDNTKSVKHTRLELTIVPTTPESMHTYGNEFVSMLERTASHEQNVPEALLQKALTQNDPSFLEKLAPFEDMYESSLVEAISMPVPEALVEEHLAFMNATEALLLNIHSMRIALEDPLFTLGRLRSFEPAKEELTNALKSMYTMFKSEGVTFEKTEPGSFFYLFDAV